MKTLLTVLIICLTSILGIANDTITTYPYYENFEGGQAFWTSGGTSNSWAFGTPSKSVINSAASGVNAWVTGGLTGQYNFNEHSYVLGPCFDFSNLVKPIIQLDIFWECEFNWDGANLESSIDNGASWQAVGSMGDPFNWYNGSNIFIGMGMVKEGWTGVANDGSGPGSWLTAEHELIGLGGQALVQFRISFDSDFSNQNDGFAFDNILIFDTPGADISVLTQVSPSRLDCSDDSTMIAVQIANTGSQIQSNIPVSTTYSGPSSGILSTIYPGPLNPGDSAIVMVGTVNTTGGGVFNFTSYSDLATDTLKINDTIFITTKIMMRPPMPVAIEDTVFLCSLDSTVIGVVQDSFELLWYDVPIGGSPIYVDTHQINTGFLASDTIWYVEARSTKPIVKITQAEQAGIVDYIEIQNTGLAPVDVTGWTVVVGESYGNINFVDTTQWTMTGIMQAGEIRFRDDHPASANYWGANIYWIGGEEGWAMILDQNNKVVDLVFFQYLEADIQTFAPIINGSTIDISDHWIGDGIQTGTMNDINYSRIGNVDQDDASNWIISFGDPAGKGVQNPGLTLPVLGGISTSCESRLRTPIIVLLDQELSVNLGPDTTHCTEFEVNAFNSSFTSYLWNTGDTISSITVDTSGSYYLEVMNTGGCVGSDTIEITILPSPVVDLGPDATHCIEFEANAFNPDFISYLWNTGDTTSSITIDTSGSYYLEVMNAGGCVDSDTIEITIFPSPVVDLGPDTTHCTEFEVNAFNSSFTSYLWNTGDTTSSITVDTSGSYYLEVMNTGGCIGSDTIEITILPSPVVDLGPDATFCDEAMLDAGNPGASYLWSTGDLTQILIVDSTGIYTVSVIDSLGCEGKDSITVGIEFAPVATPTFNLVNDSVVTFMANATVGVSFVWDFGDGNQDSTNLDPTHTYTSDGTYSPTLTISNDCGTFDTTLAILTIGVENDLFGQNINVYPNPTAGTFFIVGNQFQAINIEVYNLSGQLIYNYHEKNIKELYHAIDLKKYPDGIFLIKVSDGEHTAYKRVIRR